jgi:hypothetical protein
VPHAITIVGYNNNTSTFTYLDTCGSACGGGTNGGTHSISQQTMYNALVHFVDLVPGVQGGVAW